MSKQTQPSARFQTLPTKRTKHQAGGKDQCLQSQSFFDGAGLGDMGPAPVEMFSTHANYQPHSKVEEGGDTTIGHRRVSSTVWAQTQTQTSPPNRREISTPSTFCIRKYSSKHKRVFYTMESSDLGSVDTRDSGRIQNRVLHNPSDLAHFAGWSND